jgi:hypothetical protein
MIKSRFFMLAAALIASGSLSGCADSFRANVTRFHNTLPPPEQGATFAIRADDARNDRSLEFAHYADLVAGRLTALGYSRAADPASARLVVRLGYDVDKGHERVVTSYSRRAFYGPDIYPVIVPGRNGPRVRYVVGYRDPFLWGSAWGWDDPFGRDVDSFTVYQSQLSLKIDRADGGRVFEGTARAQSLSNRLTYLVPNLVDALFQDFPGKNGEDVRVTIAPEPKTKN